MPVRVAVILACVAAVTSGGGASARQPDGGSAAALLDAYDRGAFAVIDDRLATLPRLGLFMADLASAAFARSDGALRIAKIQDPAVIRTRTAAAALALEAAHASGGRDRANALVAIEWGCETLRASRVATPAERAWLQASLAVLAGLGGQGFFASHAEHAVERFPDDGRFHLARAVAAELATFPERRDDGVTLEEDQGPQSERLIYLLREARARDAVRAEATTRLGYTLLRNEKFREAEALLRVVEDSDATPRLRYLAHLFHGRALDRLGAREEAVDAYRRAAALFPRAQTAAIALAAALVRAGRADEAASVAADAVARPSAAPEAGDASPDDPWLSYGQGDLPIWSELRRQMRAAVAAR